MFGRMKKTMYGKATSEIKQRDILLLRFPFSDSANLKVRPILVLSNFKYNSSQRDIVVCPITSKLVKTPYSILIDTGDLESGLLRVKSRVRADKIASIEKSFVVHRIGRLNKRKFNTVKSQIFALLSE